MAPQPAATAASGSLWPRRESRLAWLVAALVAASACWNARAVLGFDFVAFDDDINILFNPHLGPPGREALRWMFADSDYMRRYVPLGWLSFSSVYGFSGLSPTGYHAANLLVHVLNAGLVYALLLAIVRRFASGTGERWPIACAGWGAGWWALHPMKAETVGWASGLLYGVSGCLALLSVLTFLRARTAARGPGCRAWLVATMLLYGGSVFVYPMSIGVLAVFVLLDVADRARRAEPVGGRRWAAEIAVLALPGVASAVASWLANQTAPEFWPRPAGLAEFGVGERVLQTLEVARYYLWRPWWPAGLTPAPTWVFDAPRSVGAGLWSAVVVIGGTLLGCSRARWRSGVLLLWIAHFAVLAPMLGFTERTYFPSDRYHYLPSVVVSAAVALGLARLRGGSRIGAGWVAIGAGLALGATQRGQLDAWHGTDTLMRRIVEYAGHAGFKAHTYWRWTVYHLNRGERDEAERVVAEGLRREADPAALAQAREALLHDTRTRESGASVVPLAAFQHHQLARDFLRVSRTIEAEEHFRAALAIAPDYAEAAYNLAVFHALHGRAMKALSLYFWRIAPAPNAAVSSVAQRRLLSLIADGFAAGGRLDAARRTVEYALALSRVEPAGLERSAGADATVVALEAQRARFRAAAAARP